MGIVLSTLISWALQIAWNCQRLLDPLYRCVENKCEISPEPNVGVKDVVKPMGVAHIVVGGAGNSHSVHQENRIRRRAQYLGYLKRPLSYDTDLVARASRTDENSSCSNNRRRNFAKSRLVTSSLSSPPQVQQARYWELTSSSGCSSDSGTDLDTDSEIDLESSMKPESEKTTVKEETDGEVKEEFGMSAAEEADFRLTVGRGYFSRSKKDRFLNHLRLEKRLNDLNKEFFEVACRTHSRIIQRHHSGDLHRIA